MIQDSLGCKVQLFSIIDDRGKAEEEEGGRAAVGGEGKGETERGGRGRGDRDGEGEKHRKG